MVTKLKRQLKNLSKKRAHRKNVERRREERAKMDRAEKKESDQVRELIVENANLQPNPRKAKPLTRKQQRRKQKGIERGEAFQQVLAKKLAVKKSKIKVRATTRNDSG
jgi:hypothetical protein